MYEHILEVEILVSVRLNKDVVESWNVGREFTFKVAQNKLYENIRREYRNWNLRTTKPKDLSISFEMGWLDDSTVEENHVVEVAARVLDPDLNVVNSARWAFAVSEWRDKVRDAVHDIVVQQDRKTRAGYEASDG